MATVFVASSTEARETAERVATCLESADLKALRWWEAFKAGDLTLDRLRSLSDSADGAILVWDSDDTTWHRSKQSKTTRDNCILEYGLFVSKLGRQRTGVLVKDSVRPPSDIDGITVKVFNDANRDQKIRELVSELKKNLIPRSPDIVPIFMDKIVQQSALDAGSMPERWASRALYVTDAGAARWLRVVRDPDYHMGITDHLGIQSLYVNVIKKWIPKAALRQLGLIVSLGPGDAHSERYILDELATDPADRLFEWVPVDISHGLLSYAVSRLMPSQAIPMGIVGDYEDGLSFIFDQLIPQGHLRPSMLITMCGLTFSNLDGLEGSFLSQLKARLEANDYILLDAPIKGERWSQESESSTDTTKYSPRLREFIGAGLADRLGVPEQGIVDSFCDRIRVDVTDRSDVPGTHSIAIVDSESKQLLLRRRRYDLDAFKDWLNQQDGLDVIHAATTNSSENGVKRIGVFLLKKR
jgi:Predicted nucleotide-binding protein containing TIR-like domain/Histidine-specific methyltransferase, SAM-dependent